MPELPEVENVRAQLTTLLHLPRVVESMELFRPDLRFPFPKGIRSKLQQNELLAIDRRAKYLLFQFANGWMLSHLGMTGSWRVESPGEPRLIHDHIRIKFKQGPAIIYHDPRRFGFVDWIAANPQSHARLKDLAPEPLGTEFTPEYLKSQLTKRSTSVKAAIMDQHSVVGVGNIYASESLFRAGVRPTRRASRVTTEECIRIVNAIKEVLGEAVEAGGSTIRDYRGADGEKGKFQSRFFVYERKSQPCRVCQRLILSRVIAGRSTYWCPSCQK